MQNQPSKKRLVLISVMALVFIMLVLFLSTRHKNSIDTLPTEGTSDEYSDSARVVGGGDLFKAVGGDTAYDVFRKDLYAFAKKAYKEYKPSNKIVGFEVTSRVINSNDSLTFSGKYGSVNHAINITVKKLGNSRIISSIVDSSNNLSFDSELPSNSKRNIVIGSLPINTSEYTIEYNESSDSFLINIYSGTNDVLSRATADLAARLGLNDLSTEKYTFVRSGNLPGGSLAD